MYTVITSLIIVVSIFLICAVLMQNAKGGGLAQNFAGQQHLLGVRKTTDFLEKATWTLAAALVVLSLIATISIHSGKKTEAQKNVVSTDKVEQVPSAANAMQGNAATPNAASDAAPQQ